MLNTQRSEDPESKSMFMVCPPMEIGAKNSESPVSGVAATTPLSLVVFAAALIPAVLELEPAEIEAVEVLDPAPAPVPAFPPCFLRDSRAALRFGGIGMPYLASDLLNWKGPLCPLKAVFLTLSTLKVPLF